MSFSERFIMFSKRTLPAPFTIAVLLTFLTVLLAFTLTPAEEGFGAHLLNILSAWESGMWKSELLTFAMQMMLMLVLGHVLALTAPVNRGLDLLLAYCRNTASAAFTVCILTLLVAFLNWGLGLIFGAIFARKVAEFAKRENIPLNYPLIGAAGYSGLMVWHGGLSGSAPIKIAEAGHFFTAEIGQIPMSETVLSTMNVSISLALLLVLPVSMYLVGKRLASSKIELPEALPVTEPTSEIAGAERLDNSPFLAYGFGAVLVLIAIYKAAIVIGGPGNRLGFLNPNFINLSLLGIGILMHGSVYRYLKAIDQAIIGTSGILLQFPLYFGIMGIMAASGLVEVFSGFFVNISNVNTFPLFTFFSAAVVNIFVPSGGGQWAVQGPIIIDAAQQLQVSIPKCVMAMAYGDQLTNMMQPFWALPLLGITGLKAREILPHTLLLMLLGIIIFGLGLLFF